MTRRSIVSALAALSQMRGSIAAQTPLETAANEDFWFAARMAFTVDRNLLNFNNGSVCPAPKVVQEAMHRYWTVTNLSPSHYVDELLLPETEVIREELARDFGCSPEELALTRNTSEGLHTVLLGMDLKRGDEVLTTTQDYPSMLASIGMRGQREGIVLKQFAYPTPPQSERQLFDLFFAQVTERTRAILVSHMTYTTGQIFPVAAIAKEARRRGILSIVDGAHGFAHLDFRVSEIGCDFYATSLHKWLTAPVGTGFLYMRREHVSKVWPLTGVLPAMADNIRKFESVGTQPVAMRNAIADALAFHRGLGAKRKEERLRYLRRRWEGALRSVPRVILRNTDRPEQSCGIGALTVEGMTAAKLTQTLLEKYKIHVRARVIAGEFECIRVSPNVYSSVEDVDRFVRAVVGIARG